MVELPRKTLSELRLQITLEPETLFVLTEGPLDAELCAEALAELGDRIVVYKVGDLDVPGDANGGNRARVLSAVSAQQKQGIYPNNIIGIVDADFDRILGVNLESVAIMYTDFSCMEAFVWSREGIQEFSRKMYGRDISQYFQNLSDWMRKYFALLGARKEVAPQAKLPKIDSHFSKEDGGFSWEAYWKSVRAAEGVGASYEQLRYRSDELAKTLIEKDERHFIHAETFGIGFYRLLRHGLRCGGIDYQQVQRELEMLLRWVGIAQAPLVGRISERGLSLTEPA